MFLYTDINDYRSIVIWKLMVVDGQCFREEWMVHEFSLVLYPPTLMDLVTLINREFWLNLNNIHRLTTLSPGGNTTLRVDMDDFEGNTRFAKYSLF